MLRFSYLAPLFLFVPGLYAMKVGGLWTWFLPVFTFVVLPLAEQPFRGSTLNASPEEERRRSSDRLFDVMAWLVVPAQYALLFAFLWRLSLGGFDTWWENVGLVASMGIGCGVYGINLAHELGHRRTAHEQNMSLALLLTSLYMHFFIEHNRGHHRRVATEEDPASARLHETVYAFWWRSIRGSWNSAWELEAERLEEAGQPVMSWNNAMVRYSAIQLAFLAFIGLAFGPLALVGFIGAATIGFLLLETVNYIEHYGLQRQRDERGLYERVRPVHSWNTNRPLGRIFLYDLTRHSDHHANASRKYQVLRHFDESPELPAGYPAMLVLAMFPPLYFRIMDKVLADFAQRQPEAVAAK